MGMRMSGLSPLLRFTLAVWILHQAMPIARAEAFQPEAFFNAQCSGCHSVGKGEVVGPDLKGVVSRHSRPWLHAFIRSSQSLVRTHDREATDLFGRYRKVMPDHDMKSEEIDQLLAFIQKGGPQGEPEVRLASAATPAERARGRRLFLGETRFANGAAACSRCHVAGDAGQPLSGGLAGDLTHVYGKYGDWALSRALVEPHFPLMAQIYSGRPLTGAEAYAVGAFLYDASRVRGQAPPPAPATSRGLPLLGFGSSALVLLLAGRDPRRRP